MTSILKKFAIDSGGALTGRGKEGSITEIAHILNKFIKSITSKLSTPLQTKMLITKGHHW